MMTWHHKNLLYQHVHNPFSLSQNASNKAQTPPLTANQLLYSSLGSPPKHILAPVYVGGLAALAAGILPSTPPLKLVAGTFCVAFAARALYSAKVWFPTLYSRL
jgi:hypothetical protein